MRSLTFIQDIVLFKVLYYSCTILSESSMILLPFTKSDITFDLSFNLQPIRTLRFGLYLTLKKAIQALSQSEGFKVTNVLKYLLIFYWKGARHLQGNQPIERISHLLKSGLAHHPFILPLFIQLSTVSPERLAIELLFGMVSGHSSVHTGGYGAVDTPSNEGKAIVYSHTGTFQPKLVHMAHIEGPNCKASFG